MRNELSVSRSGGISHVSFGWFVGRRRIFDVLSGAFTASLICFRCVVPERMFPNSQTSGVSVANRSAAATIVKATLGVLGVSV